MELETRPGRNTALRLFALSFISLFLELMLIRWVPAVVRLVAYYANLMLISSFLGLGLGVLLARRRKLWNWLPPIMLTALGLFWVFGMTVMMPNSPSEARFFTAYADRAINYLLLFATFGLNVAMFMPLGQAIGERFSELPPLRAYAWDLGGSLAGTISFAAFSLLHFSPIVGFCAVMLIYLVLSARRGRVVGLLCFPFALIVLYLSTSPAAIWSPYYYIVMYSQQNMDAPVAQPPAGLRTMPNPPMFYATVGRDFYQMHGTLNPTRYLPGSPEGVLAAKMRAQYSLPYFFAPHSDRVAVLGSGGGMDVEAALLNGAQHVDAIDIDSQLIALSHRFNAGDIYSDPRVSIQVNDGRAALRKLRGEYDLVVFGFLDSQALFSSMSNIRLDGYIYTVESIRTAFEHLKPDGVLSLSFASDTAPWLPAKLRMLLLQGTGREPVAFRCNGGLVFCVARGASREPPASVTSFVNRVVVAPVVIKPPTDNWPFLYLSGPTIPSDYAIVIGGLVLIIVLLTISVRGLHFDRGDGHFFFLGLAFLLLQTKSITDCSLYFGTTWLVTNIVITGVLLMVLTANLLAMRLTKSPPWLYLPLLASLLMLQLVPRDLILAQPFAVRLIWALLIVPLPIFFAGLIFSTTFRAAPRPSLAFGANLVGATIGGLLEYLGMAWGTHAVGWLVVAAYLASFLCRFARPRTSIFSELTTAS